MKSMRVLFNVRISVLLATLLTVVPCAAESMLTINIEGFETDDGRARIVLFNSPESYLGTVQPSYSYIVSLPIRGRRATWSVYDLPNGTYAAIAYHDQNSNEELDRPYFLLPLEPYGFSNDAFMTFGIPDFDLVKFDFGDGLTTQNISIRYNPVAIAVLALRPFINLIALTIVLVLPLLVCSALRRWLGVWASDTRRLGRFGLTLLLVMTSSAHFISAEHMLLMLPDWVPARAALIYATGVLEVALAIGLWMPRLRQGVGFAIALMLVAFLPANIYAAINCLPYGGAEMGPSYLFVRIPYQIFLVWWTAWATGLINRRHNQF